MIQSLIIFFLMRARVICALLYSGFNVSNTAETTRKICRFSASSSRGKPESECKMGAAVHAHEGQLLLLNSYFSVLTMCGH